MEKQTTMQSLWFPEQPFTFGDIGFESAKDLLIYGCNATKFGKKGKPHGRCFYILEDNS